MTDLRELDVVELGQIEGGNGPVTCTPTTVLVCDADGSNCSEEQVCTRPPPKPQ